MVKKPFNNLNFLLRQIGEGCAFRKELTKQTVKIFICSPLPRGVGVCKIYLAFHLRINLSVVSELLSMVASEAFLIACVNSAAVLLGIFHNTALRLTLSTWVTMQPLFLIPRTVSLSQCPIVLRSSTLLGRSWIVYSISRWPHLLFLCPPWRLLPLIRIFFLKDGSNKPFSSPSVNSAGADLYRIALVLQAITDLLRRP